MGASNDVIKMAGNTVYFYWAIIKMQFIHKTEKINLIQLIMTTFLFSSNSKIKSQIHQTVFFKYFYFSCYVKNVLWRYENCCKMETSLVYKFEESTSTYY